MYRYSDQERDVDGPCHVYSEPAFLDALGGNHKMGVERLAGDLLDVVTWWIEARSL